MNCKRTLVLFVTMIVLLLGASQVTGQQDVPQSPQGTYGYAFTYQGQLKDAGGPVNGTCDLRFILWNAESGGTQVGNTLTWEGAEIEDGLFTARLDFGGMEIHNGSARWLEVDVRCPAGSGDYVPLNPRQELTGAPAALSLALPFTAEANIGGPLVWFENDGDGEAAGFSSAQGYALWVGSAGLDGLYVASSGQNGLRVVSAGAQGLQIDAAGGNGVYVGSAGGQGVHVGSTGNEGVYVGSAGWSGVFVESAVTYGMFVGWAGHDGVHVNASDWNGMAVNSAGWDGVYVGSAGNPSTWVSNQEHNGFEVAGAAAYGLWVGRADWDGVMVYSAGGDGVSVGSTHGSGVHVGSAHESGVHVDSADSTGLYVGLAGADGVYLYSAGSPSSTSYSPDYNGFEVAGAQGHGLYVGRADDTGVFVHSAGWNGVVVEEAGGDGVRATATVYNALYGDTANAQGEWGLYTPDKVHAQNVTLQTLTLVAQVTGPDALSPGDIVAAAGVAPPLLDNGEPLPLVRLAAAEWNGVVGVVEGRLALTSVPQPEGEEEEQRLELRSAEGPAQSGDYVALTVLGLARVKVDAGQGIIQPGTRLTSGTSGRARALKTVVVEGLTLAESAPTIGIALAAPDENGLVWVLVNPQ